MSLAKAVRDEPVRTEVSSDAVAEAGRAVRSRRGFSAAAAIMGLETIHRMRPGFLQQHVHAMLPDLALAIEPHWLDGVNRGDGAQGLVAQADLVTSDLLAVTDAYVASATDPKAIAVYRQLRPRAPKRIAEQMPRIAEFIERHTPAL